MKANLRIISRQRLRWVFDFVFDMDMPPTFNKNSVTPAEATLLLVIKSMQIVNFERRTDECVNLFRLFNEPYFLEPNSEGTTMFLAMALAIKELFALDDTELQRYVLDCH